MKNIEKLAIFFLISFVFSKSLMALPECPKNNNPESWTNCTGSIGGIRADFRNGKLHGNGVYIAGEVVLKAKFSNGQMDGYFTIEHPECNASGQVRPFDSKPFPEGIVKGTGTYNCVDGKKYSGEIVNMLPEGKGTISFPNGDKYVGLVQELEPNGIGTLTKKNGEVIKGKWSKGKLLEQPKLETAFISLSKERRKKIQEVLKSLNLYKSSIDGLYGKGTEAALRSYNKNYLGNPSLNVSQNVNALIKAIEVGTDAPDALNSLSFAELLDKIENLVD